MHVSLNKSYAHSQLVEKMSLVVILSEAKNLSCPKSQREEGFFVAFGFSE